MGSKPRHATSNQCIGFIAIVGEGSCGEQAVSRLSPPQWGLPVLVQVYGNGSKPKVPFK